MSRLYKVMKMSTEDESIAKFRSASFRLVKETEDSNILGALDEKTVGDVLVLLTKLNHELKKRYKGVYRYDLCIDEGCSLDVLKIKKKQAKSLSLLCHRTNDKLSKIKKNVEINLTLKDDKE